MTIALFLLVFSLLAAQIILFYYVYVKVKRVIRAYFTTDGVTGSHFALAVSSVADVFVSRAMASIKGTNMQTASVSARAVKTVEQAVMQDVITAENPLLGAAMSVFPSLSKALQKNPGLLNIAMPLLAKIGKGAPMAKEVDGNSRVDFKL
jgi:hypothetical protein